MRLYLARTPWEAAVLAHLPAAAVDGTPLTDRLQVARAAHPCAGCGETVEPGTTHRYRAARPPGASVVYQRWCYRCCDAGAHAAFDGGELLKRHAEAA